MGLPDLFWGLYYIPNESQTVSFLRNRFLRALPEFFRGWTELFLRSDDADRDSFRLRSFVEGAFAIPDFKYGLRNTFATGSSNCGPAKYAASLIIGMQLRS